MATLIEREVHHGHSGDSESSASTMIVAVLAIVLILGFALFLFGAFPFNNVRGGTDDGRNIDVNVEGQLPAADPVPNDQP